MTCGASRDDRFLESKNRSANHSVLHPCAALSPLVARAPTIPDAMQGRKRFGLASCTRTRLQQGKRIFPLSQCGWAPRDLDLACPPPDARARKKKTHVAMADIDTCGRMAEGRALPGHRYWSKRAEIQHRACPDTQSSEVLLYLASKPRFLHGLRLEESVLNTQYSIFSAWYLRRTNF